MPKETWQCEICTFAGNVFDIDDYHSTHCKECNTQNKIYLELIQTKKNSDY